MMQPSNQWPDERDILPWMNAAPPPRRRTLLTLSLVAFLAGGLGGVAGTTISAPAAQTAPARVVTAQPVAQISAAYVASVVYAQASPAVVEIQTTAQLGRGRYAVAGTGSGFVVDSGGLIMTNQHVIAGARTIMVQFSSGDQQTAAVIASDSDHDLALLRVASIPAGVSALALADSDAVEVGATVLAIGSPFGLEETLTQGIISAVGRSWSSGAEQMSGLIQTDAAINPGNSGGPLLNDAGEVIGVNTLIESPVEGNVGIGFAVPSNIVRQLLEQASG
jgi:serine protease Do